MDDSHRIIRIAAALIMNDAGRTLVVRKRGTLVFMQAGGKIEPGETPRQALARELAEELGGLWQAQDFAYLGQFSAPAANETGHLVKADIFALRAPDTIAPAAEIAEAIWIDPRDRSLPLAPLSRDHVLPLALQMPNCDQSRSGAPSGKSIR